jgi:hypothetical protein
VKLVDFIVAGKECSLVRHLRHNAANTPHVDASGVHVRAEQDFWSAVPTSNNFHCEWTVLGVERAGKTEVGELQATVTAY